MKKTHAAITDKGSPITHYQDVIVGRKGFFYFLYFEFCLLFSFIPGALGMVLRKLFWPKLFHTCGKKVLFGTNIILRHPNRISIGDKVIISDGCILDGRNSSSEITIQIESNVMISNNVTLSCKDGSIKIGENTGINTQTIIQSTNGCSVKIGRDVIIGQRAFIIGGGNYNTNDISMPIRLQGIKQDGGVDIGENVWLGANSTVLGGVAIGHGSIIAAGSIMTKSVAPYSICKGIPGKVMKNRLDT